MPRLTYMTVSFDAGQALQADHMGVASWEKSPFPSYQGMSVLPSSGEPRPARLTKRSGRPGCRLGDPGRISCRSAGLPERVS